MVSFLASLCSIRTVQMVSTTLVYLDVELVWVSLLEECLYISVLLRGAVIQSIVGTRLRKGVYSQSKCHVVYKNSHTNLQFYHQNV